MAMIDVRVALSNPYTLERFTVTRRSTSANLYGETTLTPGSFPNCYGIITPSSPDDLDRLPEEESFKKAISISTNFALLGASDEEGQQEGFQPDLVLWGGNTFIVRVVEDWSHYGPGWVHAICVLFDLLPAPEVTTNG